MSDPNAQPADPSRLSDEDVRHVAKLARLAVPDEELRLFAEQLQDILGYVNQISQVDVSQIPTTDHVLPMSNVFRDDVVGPHLTLDQVLQNAPDTDPPFFRVPKVIGADEDSAG